MNEYSPKEIESKWQKRWETQGLFRTPEHASKDSKMYILPQLPYPSGSGLHVGHAEVYTACDIFARYQRMIGKDVLQVIGWDSFGLPAENYAIKTNVHPVESTNKAIDNFRSQIRALGISVDWEREVGSHNPDYYKWTQWLFLLMYSRGLAYRKNQAVNWCESCKTVLANEQVVDGQCERCDTTIVQKQMEQWYLRITDYADRLLEGLDRIDWPEETKKRQRDWIGKSEGAQITFEIKKLRNSLPTSSGLRRVKEIKGEKKFSIEVFTTRPDTIFGATYMVIAPEHSLIQELEDNIENWDEVNGYIEKTKKKTDLERQVEQEKTGVELKGITAINPVTKEEIPVWIADYVLASYGTGAIMAVPAHDERDYAFAKEFGLEIRQVVFDFNDPIVDNTNRDNGELKIYKLENFEKPYSDSILSVLSQNAKILGKKRCIAGKGIAINSDFLNGLSTDQAKEKIIAFLEEKEIGKRHTQYKLRDWSVSRQRFWGAPIPMLVNEEEKNKKRTFVLLHGYEGTSTSNFLPAMKLMLEAQGHTVYAPDLPNTNKPNLDEQAQYIIDTIPVDEETVILGHSLGGPTLMTYLEKTGQKVKKVVFADSFYRPVFADKKRPNVEKSRDWSTLDLQKIKDLCEEIVVVADNQFSIIPKEETEEFARSLGARLVYAMPEDEHYCGLQEPVLEKEILVTGLRPLKKADLPVILPQDVDFKPTGESPLRYSDSFQNNVEETYGKGWKREVDTLDTFMCSSWYYFRYLDPNNDDAFASSEMLEQWMPVDFYLGGAEHVNGHLLYSRFITKVLYDAGYINFDEPFAVHRHQGLILGEDNRKMSKRWGNVINPTDVVNEYGADTTRMYEMFMGPLEDTKPWNTGGVKGIRRFLEKVWRLQEKVVTTVENKTELQESEKELHKTIKKVTEDTATLGFNTAIAKMMQLVNLWTKQTQISKKQFELFLLLLAPYAPHIADEIWEKLGHTTTIARETWPAYDEIKIVDDMVTLAVQVNGKVRASIDMSVDASEEDVKKTALAHENVQKWLDGKQPKKVIYVKGKIVSIVL